MSTRWPVGWAARASSWSASRVRCELPAAGTVSGSSTTRAGPSRSAPTSPCCLEAADRICPGVVKHIGRLPGIEPLDLTFADVLHLRQCAPQVALDVAHVIALAQPTPTAPGGMAVATVLPDLYAGYNLRINPLGE
jgi:hypothetical protein